MRYGLWFIDSTRSAISLYCHTSNSLQNCLSAQLGALVGQLEKFSLCISIGIVLEIQSNVHLPHVRHVCQIYYLYSYSSEATIDKILLHWYLVPRAETKHGTAHWHMAWFQLVACYALRTKHLAKQTSKNPQEAEKVI